ncbi:MAG: type II toxin-antitoxin system YafQ family toxin [Leptospirales bacterium]
MLNPIRSTQFKKDVKRMMRRNVDVNNLKYILDFLVKGKELPEKCKNHNLIGNFSGRQECHIEPDWLFLVRINRE